MFDQRAKNVIKGAQQTQYKEVNIRSVTTAFLWFKTAHAERDVSLIRSFFEVVVVVVIFDFD